MNDTQINTHVLAIAKGLKCPDCVGQALDSSETISSIQLRDEIHALLKKGIAPDAIRSKLIEEGKTAPFRAETPTLMSFLSLVALCLIGALAWRLYQKNKKGHP